MTRETLYEQVGGEPAIADLVERFYGRLRVDPRSATCSTPSGPIG